MHLIAPDAPAAPAARDAPAAAVPRIKATLYFASEDGLRLVPVESEVALAEGVVAQARSIVESQLAAPAPPPLVSTIPKGATLRGIFVSQRNEAFVDLDPSIRTAHPGGTLQELMTVYTIVNALLTQPAQPAGCADSHRRPGSGYAGGSCGPAAPAQEKCRSDQ